jgi:uncharacterized ferritin-like protein (DUF455 family)
MEIREFAERVLFSTSLEGKLTPGADLTDAAPGAPLGTPGEPGRPADLRMRTGGVRADFPSAPRLIDEEQRGVLLHFFANHELLATELMALVLLKFPEAPAEFRRGIVRTLHEEQQHTKWYLRRMEECGIRFGDFRLNRFFWDSIAPMETPLDYVTRLSLTFEQANLDYARHYAGLMREAGDEKSARILSRIYHDEIGHVGYGLKWFRRWKAVGASDWEAYRHQLHFPLSPARGRGNAPFNAEGRRKAGLTESFIREIELFSRSKGRTPNVTWFTPDAEAAMAGGLEGKEFTPRKEVRALQQDLEILPAFLFHRDDVVLMRRVPSAEHRKKLHRLGFEIPECEVLDEGGRLRADSLLRSRKINDLRPWAWCPQSAALLAPLGHEKIRWNAAIRQLFAKDWQVEKLGLDSFVCRTAEEIPPAFRTLRQQGFSEAVAKCPYGAAGQKNHKLSLDEAGQLQAERVRARQGSVIVEPCFDRLFDFSVHYDVTATGLRRVALVQLENDRRGQFQACVAGGKFRPPAEVARFLLSGALAVYDDAIPKKLAPLLAAAGYHGPVGIDAFVYRLLDGSLALRPIVELNPRHTMGRLAWELSRRVAHGRRIRFELLRSNHPAETIRELETARPAALGRGGKLIVGCVVLNEPQFVLAVLTVGESQSA